MSSSSIPFILATALVNGAVTIVNQMGKRATIKILRAAGHPDRPREDAALIAKFVDCAGRALIPIAQMRATALAHHILSVATLPSASALLAD